MKIEYTWKTNEETDCSQCNDVNVKSIFKVLYTHTEHDILNRHYSLFKTV